MLRPHHKVKLLGLVQDLSLNVCFFFFRFGIDDDESRCLTSSGGVGREEHTYCPCGDHCGCNPCMCKRTESGGVGKAFCKCGESCTCATCAS